MIPLRIRAQLDGDREPFVVRVSDTAEAPAATEYDAPLTIFADSVARLRTAYGDVILPDVDSVDIVGDVLLVVPARGMAHRLIRARSKHNSLLVTERCDQLCVMCSQPPKAQHIDVFGYLSEAVILAPQGAILGITGGEPTLYKDDLFKLVSDALAKRPDLRFHVLTNGQHFDQSDSSVLRRLSSSVQWGIPLYAPTAAEHDAIVGKIGAFDQLRSTLALLGRVGANIELRTVLMTSNAAALRPLADYIAVAVPFVSCWAIMHLENIGYGRMNWRSLFFDNSVSFEPIAAALNVARGRGIDAVLYNFPLCTVPAPFRDRAAATISDWKRRYLDQCASCTLREECGGFFEWYPEGSGFSKVGLQ
jgi:His-Xaa-Ser system radical SAM maturase HxsC